MWNLFWHFENQFQIIGLWVRKILLEQCPPLLGLSQNCFSNFSCVQLNPTSDSVSGIVLLLRTKVRSAGRNFPWMMHGSGPMKRFYLRRLQNLPLLFISAFPLLKDATSGSCQDRCSIWQSISVYMMQKKFCSFDKQAFSQFEFRRKGPYMD